MAQLDARHQTLTSETCALAPNSDHQRRFSRATGCVKKKKKKKCPSKRSVFTQRKSLFPVCNKTQTPGECQGAALLPTPHTSSSKQNHRDKPGKVRATAGVGLQDDFPPSASPHILNKNLKGGFCKIVKFLILNYPISVRCQKFEVKTG